MYDENMSDATNSGRGQQLTRSGIKSLDYLRGHDF